jgi:hypothetical protein
MAHFNKTLASVRASAGYRTAYAFYHSNGGRRVFPFTYAYYLKIERGGSLPRPEWVVLIMRTMRIIGVPQKARLVTDFLKDLAGPAYQDLFAPYLAAPEEPLVQQSLRKLRGRLAEHVTPRQLQALAASPEAYGCFLILISTGAALKTNELALRLGAPEGACAAALHDLRRNGLLRERAGGRYEIARVGRHYTIPDDAGSLRVRKTLHAHTDELFARAGTTEYDGWVTARLPGAEIGSVIQGLQEVFQVVAGNATPMSATPDADMYLIEGKIRRLKRPTALQGS